METSIDYVDYTAAVVSTDEHKWHRRLRAYKDQFPDQARIKAEPEDNDGNMVAEVPVKWIKIKPPRACNMTDEERTARAERLRNCKGKPQTTIVPEETEEKANE